MFQNVILGWVTRRGLELGGLFGAAVAWYLAQPPATQDAINRIFTGGWREVPVGIYVGVGAALWGYIWSFRSTVRPQVVTTDKQQIPLPSAGEGAGTTRKVETIAAAAPKPRTLWERLFAR